ncbi:hypothetical protein BLNAU_7076 [Blattamonas nauphoetae]|uniref:Uncharacterized protein n=1 Tax=Blattamonas nauphoetae TaxID=2049346 RepID=A0ABQ9Y2C4_9EUKA|nr:hypothetical protein BLNAU_7076 [Blattamonas nauphoetae]
MHISMSTFINLPYDGMMFSIVEDSEMIVSTPVADSKLILARDEPSLLVFLQFLDALHDAYLSQRHADTKLAFLPFIPCLPQLALLTLCSNSEMAKSAQSLLQKVTTLDENELHDILFRTGVKAHLAEMSMNWLADLDDDTCFVEACQLILDKFKIALRRSERDRKQNNRSCHSAFLRDLLHAKLSLLLISSLSAHLDQQTLSLTPSASLSLPSKAHLLDAMMVALHSAQRMFSHSSVKPHHLHTVTPILNQLWTFILRYYPLFPQQGQVSLANNLSHPFNLGGGHYRPIDTEMMNAFFDTFLFKSVDTPIWLAQKIQRIMMGPLAHADYVYIRADDLDPKMQVQSLVDQWLGEFSVSKDSKRENGCLVRLWALSTCGTLMYFRQRLHTLKMGQMLTDATKSNTRWFICNMIYELFDPANTDYEPFNHDLFFTDQAEPLWNIVTDLTHPELSQQAIRAFYQFLRHSKKDRGQNRILTNPLFRNMAEGLPMLLASVFVNAKDEQKGEGREEVKFDEKKLWGGCFVDVSRLVIIMTRYLVDIDAAVLLLALFKLIKSFRSPSLEYTYKRSDWDTSQSPNDISPLFTTIPLALTELAEIPPTITDLMDFFVESHVFSILHFTDHRYDYPMSEYFLELLPLTIAVNIKLNAWFSCLPQFATIQIMKTEMSEMVEMENVSILRSLSNRFPAVVGMGLIVVLTLLHKMKPRKRYGPPWLLSVFNVVDRSADLTNVVASHSSSAEVMWFCAHLAVHLLEQNAQQEFWLILDSNTQAPITPQIPKRIHEMGLLSTTAEWIHALIEEGVEDVSETHKSKSAVSMRMEFGVNSSFQFRSSYPSRHSHRSRPPIDLRPSIDPGFIDEDDNVFIDSLFDF